MRVKEAAVTWAAGPSHHLGAPGGGSSSSSSRSSRSPQLFLLLPVRLLLLNTTSELLHHCSQHPVRPAAVGTTCLLQQQLQQRASPSPPSRDQDQDRDQDLLLGCLGGPGGAEQPGLMAGHEWEDWFEREEFIGQISDMRVQNLQGRKQGAPARLPGPEPSSSSGPGPTGAAANTHFRHGCVP